MDILKRFYNYR